MKLNKGAFLQSERIINKELLKSYQQKQCEVCCSRYMVSGHHIKTKGSGGHDIPENLIALCFKHHEEIHRGTNSFIRKYPVVGEVLKAKGWVYEDWLDRWYNENARAQ